MLDVNPASPRNELCLSNIRINLRRKRTINSLMKFPLALKENQPRGIVGNLPNTGKLNSLHINQPNLRSIQISLHSIASTI